MNDEEIRRRISLLREAMERLDESVELVENATRMSPVAQRASDDLIPRMMECRDSLQIASMTNLIKDLEYMGEDHPIWTRPLTSVKYIDRKD